MKSGVFQKVTGLVHIQASRQLTLIERKVSNEKKGAYFLS